MEKLRSFINEKDKYSSTPLQYAAREGKWGVVNLFLDKTTNTTNKGVLFRSKEDQPSANWTTMHYAAVYNGNLNLVEDVLELLSDKEAIVNARDGNGWTPLHYAVYYNRPKIVAFLIYIGANINAETSTGKTVFQMIGDSESEVAKILFIVQAVKDGKLDKAKSLLCQNVHRSNAQTRKKDKCSGTWTLLHCAVYNGDLDLFDDLFQLLLNESDDDINAKDECGWTPLHYAVYYNEPDTVNFLVDKEANINAKENYGWTPLHLAAYYDNVQLELAALLIEKGANTEAKTDRDWKDYKKGSTPLDIANVSDKQELADLLGEKKAQVNSDWSPLHYAAKHGKKELAAFMIENGANIDAKDKDGKTPLDIAIDQKHDDVVEYLEKIKEEREKPVQRKRRHHHGDHDRHHSSHKPLAIDLSNQPEIAASSAARPSSWINVFANTIVDAVKGVSQFISSPFKPAIDMEHSQPSKAMTTQGTDVNSTLLLLDVFIRKITGQKYISTADQNISSLEAIGYALNITERFEKTVKQAAKDSKISMHRLDIDFMKVQGEITRKVMGGKLNEISGILKSHIEKTCPGREAGCSGKLSPKKFNKFMTMLNSNLDKALNQPISQTLHGENDVLKVKEQQESLESNKPRSYLNDTSVQGHLTQARDLRLR